MAKKIFILFTVSLFLFLTSFIPNFSSAQSLDESLNNLQQKRQEYEAQLESLRKKEKTLKNEIAYMETQIDLSLTRIQEAEAAIKLREEELIRLQGDIGLVGGKIDNLSRTLETQKKIFSNRAATAYKSQSVGPLEMFLGGLNTNDFSFLVNRFKYLKVFELQDSKFLKQMDETRQVFQTQRVILSDKKDQVQEIKGQIEKEKKNLEIYKVTLIRQRTEKKSILSLTVNDEGKYQQLLTQILAEIESVSRGLTGGIKLGEVRRGDIIGREGNSGCVLPAPSSSNPLAGAHLHFGVYKEGIASNPRAFLDSGQLAWPEENGQNYVTQNFGDNYDFYMRNFGIPGHNAIDMDTGYGSPIKAAADGVAYLTGDNRSYGSWCNGKARGIRVEHNDGLVTIYWHIL